MTISSPCNRQCCLNEQDICQGCFRSLAEILEWSGANEQQRMATLNRVAQRKAQTALGNYSQVMHPKAR